MVIFPLSREQFLWAFLGGGMAFLLVALTTEWITHLQQEKRLGQQRAVVTEKLSTIRARIEGEINSTLHLTRGLIAYVATHPDLDADEFNLLSSEIISSESSIRNIGLAPDNVIRYVYPLTGNEAALGLVYKNVPSQWPEVQKAMRVKDTVVAGPLQLVQGGMAFIARTPIYVRHGFNEEAIRSPENYWGLASIVIDIPQFYQAANVQAHMNALSIAIRKENAIGGGRAFLGDAHVFQGNPVLQTVYLPHGSWQIAAVPRAGWGLTSEFGIVQTTRVFGWLLALLIGGLITALIWKHFVTETLALRDHLTGLPNRRLLEDRLEHLIAVAQREQQSFCLLFIDLDGFKQINDNCGHKMGDQVLIEVAKRLRTALRQSDTVARIGGDEFVTLLKNVASAHTAEKVVAKLQQQLLGEAVIGKYQIEIRASIGIALYPQDGEHSDALLRAGDGAMYQEKSRSKRR